MCCPGLFDGDGRYDWYFRSPDGERYDGFAARLGEWLSEQVDCALVVVTHGMVTRLLRGLYARLPREAALILPVPQDKVFRLSDGAIEEIPVRPPDASLRCRADEPASDASLIPGFGTAAAVFGRPVRRRREFGAGRRSGADKCARS